LTFEMTIMGDEAFIVLLFLDFCLGRRRRRCGVPFTQVRFQAAFSHAFCLLQKTKTRGRKVRKKKKQKGKNQKPNIPKGFIG